MSETPASIDAILASIRARVNGPEEAPPPPPAPAPVAEPAVPLDSVVITPEAAAMTLDELMRSLLAPQIKAWLDAHMPEIVEKLAREEIKRLTGKL
jgi:cell pole-organizing protein PopZ